MRKKLESLNEQRMRFKATIERFGEKTNYKGHIESTILFKNVCRVDTNEQVTDHIWFTVGKTIRALDLKPGDIVEFDARVGDYTKGYVNHRKYIDKQTLDYKLNRPTRFVKSTTQVYTDNE